MDKISIIIPLYNKAASIKNTIDSILRQSCTNFDIIVIDDGSTDNSVEIVNSYKTSVIRVISKKNGGVSSARNVGMDIANSEWLLFLDADDLLLPDALLIFEQAIKKYPSLEIFIGGYEIQTSSGLEIHPCKCNGIISKPFKAYFHKKFLPRGGNTLIKKSIYKTIGKFDERVSYNEDWAFFLKLLSYRVAVISEPVMIYNKVFSSLSEKVPPLNKESIFYSSNLSLENKYLRLLMFQQFQHFLNRRREIGDLNGYFYLKQELIKHYNVIERIYYPIIIKINNYIHKR